MDIIAQDYDGKVSLCSDLGFCCEGLFDEPHNLWSRALVWDVLMVCYTIQDRSPPLAHALVKFSSMRFGGPCEIVTGHFKIMRVENLVRKWHFGFSSSRGVMLLAHSCFWCLSPVLPLTVCFFTNLASGYRVPSFCRGSPVSSWLWL